ncbi:hypothetical protein L596_001766 [Steinernema carpocapsae]|uniref:RBR-type E3 ubiquitin transferase n=1 Tax=Steinernema carpocapsae TaxID=34508 RepID=A0A4U8UM30_STECR|nr:hypothetical protein L596_001766 [Steinernema carpocapsae]
MSNDEHDDRRCQEDEITVLDSMYAHEEGVFTHSEDKETKTISGRIRIKFPRLNTPLTVQLTIPEGFEKHYFFYIAPIELTFAFPPNYPSTVPPIITLESIWLNEYLKEKLIKKLHEVYNDFPGFPVIFSYMQAVVDETSDMKTFAGQLDLDEFTSEFSHMSPEERLEKIQKADAEVETELFNKTSFRCKICLEMVLGKMCSRYQRCGHVFCKSCLARYFQSTLNGQVKVLECMEDGCNAVANDDLLREFLDEDEIERYERIILESQEGVVTCARASCQLPVILEETDPSSPYRYVAHCKICGHTFCILCRRVNHGIAPCRMDAASSIEQTVRAWENGSEMERRAIYQQHGGEQRFLDLVAAFRDNEWLRENSKSCPKCNFAIQRTEGCNKVQCIKCGAHFCWLCSMILNGVQPYEHFTANRSSNCYNQLFAGTELDIEDDEFMGIVEDILGIDFETDTEDNNEVVEVDVEALGIPIDHDEDLDID